MCLYNWPFSTELNILIIYFIDALFCKILKRGLLKRTQRVMVEVVYCRSKESKETEYLSANSIFTNFLLSIFQVTDQFNTGLFD